MEKLTNSCLYLINDNNYVKIDNINYGIHSFK